MIWTNPLATRLATTLLCLTLALTFGAAHSAAAYAQEACGDVVTVEAGDSLAQIAIRCGVPIPALLAANPAIDDPTQLATGQAIAIPSRGTPPGDPVTPTPEATDAEPEATDAEPEATDAEPEATDAEPEATDAEPEGPIVTLSRTQGPAGTLVRLRSEGFTERTPIEVGFGPADAEYDILAQARTNGRGRFNRAFQIPLNAMPGQEYVFVIVPSETQAEVVSDAFTVAEGGQVVEPQVSVSPSAVPAGANVQLYATGFPANTRVSYGIGVPSSETFDISSARTNASGTLRATIRVPESIVGERELVALVYVPQQQAARATSEPFTVTQQDGENSLFTTTNIYLIALEDDGRNGQETGCDDSVLPVEVEIEPTVSPLTTALETLFNIDERFYDESGLYNALYRTDLAVERIDIVDDVATIYLTGDFAIGGVCDSPRVRAQLEETALQYATVDEVQIFVNGESLDSLLSERG